MIDAGIHMKNRPARPRMANYPPGFRCRVSDFSPIRGRPAIEPIRSEQYGGLPIFGLMIFAFFLDANEPIWVGIATIPEVILAVGFLRRSRWVGKLGMAVCIAWGILILAMVYLADFSLGVWHCLGAGLFLYAYAFSKFRG